MVLPVAASTSLLHLTLTDTKGPDVIQSYKQASLLLAFLTSLNLVSPLLETSFILLMVLYLFQESIAASLKPTPSMKLRLQWLRECLQDVVLGITIMNALNM